MSLLTRAARSAFVALDARRQCRVPFLSRERILELQLRHARRMLLHAYENVPFYRAAIERMDMTPTDFHRVEDLARLPLLEAPFVRANLDQFLPRGLDKQKCLVLASAKGSKTYWDPQVAWRRLAYVERETAAWSHFAGRRYGLRQLHVLTPTSSSMANRAFWNRATLAPSWVARKFYLDPLQPYSVSAAELDRVRPDVVFSFGSYMEHFFRYLQQDRRRPHLPSVWYYGGDMPAPGWRDRIERQYGCKVYSVYATTETGRVGFECELGCGFHVNEDLLVVRAVDNAGMEVADGETGEIVVSCLYNPATVLLNYRLGDLGVVSREACGCGRNFARILALEGRRSETIELGDGRIIPVGAFLGHFRKDTQGALRARVLSGGKGRMTWQLVPGTAVDREEMRRRIVGRCSAIFGDLLAADVEFVEEIPAQPSGKSPLAANQGQKSGTTEDPQ